LEDLFCLGGRRGGVDYDIEQCHFVSYFLPNLQLIIGKKYLKTANIIDESLILFVIVLRNYSTKPSYIFQLKRELKVWKYIFSLFHFEMLIQNRSPKFRPLCLFVLTFHEYEARFVFGFRLEYKLSLFFLLFLIFFYVKLFCVLITCYNQYKLNNSSDPRYCQHLQLFLILNELADTCFKYFRHWL
jgi:hypothetical protein